MSGNKKSSEEPTWIPNSCSFSKNVIADTIAQMCNNKNQQQPINSAEKKGLAKLKELWLAKYKPSDRQPVSNPVPLPPRAPRKRKATPSAGAQCQKTVKQLETPVVDASTLDDNCDVTYRLMIPALRSSWRCRTIDLKVKARICKSNLIEQLINWELLESIMELSLAEATSRLERHVDKMFN
ncbi:hypothetical protein KR044_010681 [Drosophila immigrans]|nr:hypothetical protein KR044_010681 [Drosophila immigrans]